MRRFMILNHPFFFLLKFYDGTDNLCFPFSFCSQKKNYKNCVKKSSKGWKRKKKYKLKKLHNVFWLDNKTLELVIRDLFNSAFETYFLLIYTENLLSLALFSLMFSPCWCQYYSSKSMNYLVICLYLKTIW